MTTPDINGLSDQELMDCLATEVMGWEKVPSPRWFRFLYRLFENRNCPFGYRKAVDDSIWDYVDPERWFPLESVDDALEVGSRAKLLKSTVGQAFSDSQNPSHFARLICLASLAAVRSQSPS